MKTYINLLAATFFAITLASCDARLSTEQLTQQVLISMGETLDDSISIDSLIITRDSNESNTYTGILETSEPNGAFTYTVAVTYDGENMTWRVLE